VTQFMRLLRRQSDEVFHAVYTLFLFMKSDIGTVVLPSISMGISLAGVPDVCAFFEGIVWVTIHLLAFDVSSRQNAPCRFFQIIGVEEDRLSKPHRPISAGRINLKSSQHLHLFFVTASLIDSMRHGLFVQSTVFFILITAYNEGQLSKYWPTKSGIIAVCIGILCWGVAACFDHGRPLSSTSISALVITVLLQATTLHAQDFRDMAGDAAIGRKTLPMLVPRPWARGGLSALLLAWSIILVQFWSLPAGAALILYGVATVTAVCFLTHAVRCGLLHVWLCLYFI
ncbi:hypothetical protein HDZ31DRAFT_2151, partial [Schizophyllum fasciatum]